MHGDGVNVDAGHGVVEPVQQLLSREAAPLGVFQEVVDRLHEEGAGAAGGIEDSLVQRIGDELADHVAGEPGGGVVLSEPSSLVRRDDRLIEDGCYVGGSVHPVEPRDPVRQRGQKGKAVLDLRRPREEVRFDHALQACVALKATPLEQVPGVDCRKAGDVDSEGCLNDHAEDHRQVGVADEQVVDVFGLADGLTERRPEQVAPEFHLHADGLRVLVPGVQFAEAGYVPAVARAIEAEMRFRVPPVQGDVVQRLEGLVAQPFVKRHPAVGIFEGEGVGIVRVHRTRAGPPEQPVFPVGQDTHVIPPILSLRLFEIAVQLFDVPRVGVEARARSNPALDLDEGIERGEVDRRARAQSGGALLHDLVALDEIREDEEVTYGAGYVGLGLVPVVPPEDAPGGFRVALVVEVKMLAHGRSFRRSRT